MALEEGIKTALTSDTAVAALVSTRVRPLAVAGDDAYPYLTYTVTDVKSMPTLDGAVPDYHKAEFEVGIYSDDYDTVIALSDAVRTRLDSFGQTAAGVEFAPALFDSETDVEQVVPDGQELPVFLRVQTYKCLYR